MTGWAQGSDKARATPAAGAFHTAVITRATLSGFAYQRPEGQQLPLGRGTLKEQ